MSVLLKISFEGADKSHLQSMPAAVSTPTYPAPVEFLWQAVRRLGERPASSSSSMGTWRRVAFFVITSCLVVSCRAGQVSAGGTDAASFPAPAKEGAPASNQAADGDRGKLAKKQGDVASEDRAGSAGNPTDADSAGSDGRVFVRRGFVPLSQLFRGLGIGSNQGDENSGGADSSSGSEGAAEVANMLSHFGVPGMAGRHVFRLPSVFDEMLSDVMSGSFGSPNAEFGRSSDGKQLIAKLNIPSQHRHGGESPAERSRRQLHIAVVGDGSQMRCKIESLSGHNAMVFEHLIRLPVRVTQDGIETVANPDGTVTVKLTIIGEINPPNTGPDQMEADGRGQGDLMQLGGSRRPEGLLGLPGRPLLAKLLFGGNPLPNLDSEREAEVKDSVETLPSELDVSRCREKYPEMSQRLFAQNCVCRTSPTESGRAVCFASVLSSAVRVGRRLGKMDESTDAKHAAIACAEKDTGRAECLEAVTTKFLEFAFGGSSGTAADHNISEADQIRAAIESEDDGPSTRQRTSLGMLLLVFGCMLGCLLFFAVGILQAARKLIANGSGSANGMSSILSQRSSSTTATRGHSRAPRDHVLGKHA